ncbi:hypothetical protein CEXT_752641 [Caerostris extrusa]|uniref:Uncharacterized protein n=1 Tax=Caerostris extrusa TaxID=172846 RepID=A0AAV4PV12_CAEEX|nr:hypothetical protein CEXT_752641 [Caerostris extrusa]
MSRAPRPSPAPNEKGNDRLGKFFFLVPGLTGATYVRFSTTPLSLVPVPSSHLMKEGEINKSSDGSRISSSAIND